MAAPLGRLSEVFFAALRLVAGFLYGCHGAQKLFGVLGGRQVELASIPGAAGIIEFFGGSLIAVGLGFPYVPFLCSGQMAAAYFMAHAPRSFWPIQNGGELAAVYCFVFLFMSSRTAGILSLDRAFGRS
jgi:putative oxidoreductase